jgi:hypothetical protein
MLKIRITGQSFKLQSRPPALHGRSGPDAQGLLQRLLSNDVGAIEPGGAQYSVLCREDGGVLDDRHAVALGSGRQCRNSGAQDDAGSRLDGAGKGTRLV